MPLAFPHFLDLGTGGTDHRFSWSVEHLPQFVHDIGWHAFRAVFRVEPLRTLMGEVPYFHRLSVACSLTLVKRDMHQMGMRRSRKLFTESPCFHCEPPLNGTVSYKRN